MQSHLARRRIQGARKRAPKHPRAVEAKLQHAVAFLLGAYHERVRAAVVGLAGHVHAKRPRKDNAPGRWRFDAEPHPTDVSASRDPLVHSAFFALWHDASVLLHTSPFRRIVDAAAKKTAASVNAQTGAALGLDDHSPDLDTGGFAAAATAKMADLLGDSLDRAEDVLDEWLDLGDESPREGDEDALGGMLDEGLSGIMGKGLAWAGLAFGMLFGALTKESQQAAGVGRAIWMSTLDSHVRPAHRALDGVEFDWDDPPLKATDSDIGEDCFPGEDYNCRCVASPIPPDEE